MSKKFQKVVALLTVVVVICGAVLAGTDTFEETLEKAQKGDAQAQFDIGNMYYEGEGVSQDYSEAFKWCSKAAKQGHAKAQNYVGLMYLNAQSVKQDHK